MIKEYLTEEVKPAMGCTEPAAVALSVARAKKELKEKISKVEVIVSKSIYKNGLYVSIPGTKGLKGNKTAAALGAVISPDLLDLNLLYYSKEKDKKDAQDLIKNNRVKINYCEEPGIFIHAIVEDIYNNISECIIRNSHTGIEKIILNSKVIFSSESEGSIKKNFFEKYNLENISLEEIINISSDMDSKDIDFIFQGIDLNMKAANYCLNKNDKFVEKTGIVLSEIFSDDILSEKIRKFSSAASFTRMTGADITIMSSGGSGNQGIVTTIPVYLFGKNNSNTDEEIAKAVAISHFLSGYIKYIVGKLAPICGAFYSAGAGATAGISYLMNKNIKKMLCAIDTMISNTTGVICDGAKESCAFRVGIAAHEAYISALMADKELYVDTNQGFIGNCCNESIKNIQKMNINGMKKLDTLIISILEGRN